jgi:ferredoxin
MEPGAEPAAHHDRPRLPAPPAAPPANRAGIATELRRFHLDPAAPESDADETAGLRSAAIAALNDAPQPDAAAALTAFEEGVDAEDEDDLREGTPGALLRLAVRRRLAARRDGFLLEVRSLARRLRDRLDVEQADEARKRPEHLSGAISAAAADRLDVRALSRTIASVRGGTRMNDPDREHVGRTAATLESFAFPADEPILRIVHDSALSVPDAAGVVTHRVGDPALEALALAERDARGLLDVLRAVRAARLHLDHSWDPAAHGPWLERFDLRSFSPSERLLMPVVAAFEMAEHLETSGLGSFSRALRSGLPVQLVVLGAPGRSPELDAAHEGRLEPCYVALGHRKTFVQQSSASHPEHFLRGLFAALDHARPAVHVLDCAGSSAEARAALTCRAHPRFRFDPERGDSLAARVDFSGNPEPEAAWPTVTVECETPTGGTQNVPMATTFADYVLGEPAYRACFRRVPAACPEQALAPLADWLAAGTADAPLRVPWIWAIDADGVLQRVAVQRRLAAVCAERLDFWHQLQELAGVKNVYVTDAVALVRREAEEAAADERSRLRAEHAAVLARTRQEAVHQAMSNLARRLLDMETDAPATATSAAAPATPAPGTASATPSAPDSSPPPAAAPPAPAADSLPAPSPDGAGAEPWIATPLCTSCNDCTNINPRLFVYDANKQALIGDLAAGTYAQMVQAAEKCPARCIHPGDPWNGDEPGLDKLVERARPFQ